MLAAGSSVAETSGTLVVTSPSGINADLTINPGTYTSDVRAFARGDISVIADGGFTTFSRNLSLMSLLAGETGQIRVGAGNGFVLDIGGDLTMQTSGATFSSGAPEELNLFADGGTVNIGGNLNMFAGAAADGTQGDVEMTAMDVSENHGSISVTGQTLINTSASAAGINPDADSADSFAGDITIEASNGGAINLHNTLLFASANGQDNSGNGSGFNLGRAGDAFAGDITISASFGAITINGNLSANADGIGGRMLDGGLFGGARVRRLDRSEHVRRHDPHHRQCLPERARQRRRLHRHRDPHIRARRHGLGRTSHDIRAADRASIRPSSITIDGDTTIRADGTGGSGQTGGFGSGGRAGISGNKGTIALGSRGDHRRQRSRDRRQRQCRLRRQRRRRLWRLRLHQRTWRSRRAWSNSRPP